MAGGIKIAATPTTFIVGRMYGAKNRMYTKRYSTASGLARQIAQGPSGMVPDVLLTSDGRDLTPVLHGVADDLDALDAANSGAQLHLLIVTGTGGAPTPAPAPNPNYASSVAAYKKAIKDYGDALARNIDAFTPVPTTTPGEFNTFGLHTDYQEVNVSGGPVVHTAGFRWSNTGDLLVEFHYRYGLSPVDARLVTPA